MTGPPGPGEGPGHEQVDHSGVRRGELQHRAVRGVLWTLVHIFVSLPVAFGINIVIARTLGAVDYGRLAFLTAAMDVASGVISLGVNPALVQFGAKAHAAGRRDDVRDLLSKVQGFRLLVVAPLMTVFVVSIARIDPVLVVLAVVFGVLVPAALDGAPACLAIENKTAESARVVLVSTLVTQAVVLVVTLRLATADAVWSARLVMVAATIALSLIPVSRDYRSAILRPKLPRRLPTGFWRFALPTGLASLVATLVLSRSEIFILTWYSMPAAAGLFALAFGLAGHLFAPAQAIIGPLVPAISGLHEVDAAAVGPAFRRTVRAGSTMVAGLVGVALPTLAVLVPAIYGDEFGSAGPLVVAFGIAGGCLVVAGPVMAFTMARLSSTQVLLASVLALAVDVVLALSLIPLFAIWGAVVANVLGSAVQLAILVRGELRFLGLSWRVVTGDAAAAGVGAVGCLVAWVLVNTLHVAPAFGALLAAAIGAVVVAVGLRISQTGLTAADNAAVRSNLPNGVGRIFAVTMRVMTGVRRR